MENSQLNDTLEALARVANDTLGIYKKVQHAALHMGLTVAFKQVPQLKRVELQLDQDDFNPNPNRPVRVRMSFVGLDAEVDLSEYLQNYVDEESLGDLSDAVESAAFLLEASGWAEVAAWELELVLEDGAIYDRKQED